MIYLDYNASVPIRTAAREALMDALQYTGNASSPHHMGRRLRACVDEARSRILDRVGGKRLVFTSGGTEANALALASSQPLIVSSIEHDSVLKAAMSPIVAPVTPAGILDLGTLETLLDTCGCVGLLSVMLVNNETGVIQPVKEAARLAKARGWRVHTDASQALGHLPLNMDDLGVDMMTLSSHKCGGPAGIGALVLKEADHITPIIRGGGQEYGIRSGSLAVPLITGFAAAVCEVVPEEKSYQTLIEAALPDAIIYGQNAPRVNTVVCMGMPGVPADLQLMLFDLKGIAVSAGAACSSGTMKSSHVLDAMGVNAADAGCAIRVSMGWATTPDDIDTFIAEWKNIYAAHRLKEAS